MDNNLNLIASKAKLLDYNFNGYIDDYIFETVNKNADFYEIAILSKWSPLISDSKVILDIGANIGNHTLYWAHNITGAHIYAFEPLDINFRCLEKNIKDNSIKNVTLVNSAVGKSEGKAVLEAINNKNLGATSFKVVENEESQKDVSLVNIISINDFVKINDIKRIDFIKIDTEGFEIAVLSGMTYVLKEFRPIIWVEVSQNTGIEVKQLLESYDYSLTDLSALNLLFTPNEKAIKVDDYSYNTVLDTLFNFINKTYQYYALYETTKENINITRNTIKSLEKDKNDISGEYNKLLGDTDVDKNTIKCLIEDIDIVKNTIKYLEKEKSDISGEYNKLLEDADVDKNTIKCLIEDIDVVKKTIKSLEKEKNDISGEYNKLLGDTDVDKNTIKCLIEDIDIVKNTIKYLEKEKSDISGEYNKLLEDADVDKNTIKCLIEDIDVVKKIIESLEKEKSDISGEYNKLLEDADVDKNTIKCLIEDIDVVKKVIESLEKEKSDISGEYNTLLKDISVLKDTIMRQEEEKNEICVSYNTLLFETRSFISTDVNFLEMLKSHIESLEKTNKEHDKILNRMSKTWYGRIGHKFYRIARRRVRREQK